MSSHYALTRAEYEQELDMTLAGSFPASDPPYWTLGVSPRTDLDESAFRVCTSNPQADDTIDLEGSVRLPCERAHASERRSTC